MLSIKTYMKYWYYPEASQEAWCHQTCEPQSYLLRHRVFLGFKKPRFQVKTGYYLVCARCGALRPLEGEGKIAPYIQAVKDQGPIKYEGLSEDVAIEAVVIKHMEEMTCKK